MTEAAGAVNFPGTNLVANYSTSGGASAVSTMINTAQPNLVPSGTGVNSVYTNQYWVWNRFGGAAYNVSLTFKTGEDLTGSDAGNPGGIQLYGRPSSSDGSWTLVAAASAVDASLDQATFPTSPEVSASTYW